MRSLKTVIDNATDAFWASVASEYPEAKTGDLAPEVVHNFNKAARAAIVYWICHNTGLDHTGASHTKDEHCTVGEEYNECIVCGAGFSDVSCDYCGRHAFHQ